MALNIETLTPASTKAKEVATEEYVDTVVDDIDVSWDSLNNKDAFAQTLGYVNYAAMETAASNEETIIDGGSIRASLIEAGEIVVDEALVNNLNATGLISANKIVASDVEVLTSSLLPTRISFSSPVIDTSTQTTILLETNMYAYDYTSTANVYRFGSEVVSNLAFFFNTGDITGSKMIPSGFYDFGASSYGTVSGDATITVKIRLGTVVKYTETQTFTVRDALVYETMIVGGITFRFARWTIGSNYYTYCCIKGDTSSMTLSGGNGPLNILIENLPQSTTSSYLSNSGIALHFNT